MRSSCALDNTWAIYVHLKVNGVAVTEGQRVNVGDLIGYSGNTGNSTGPHLHFAVYKAQELTVTPSSKSFQIFYVDGSANGFIPTAGTSVTGTAPPPSAIDAEKPTLTPTPAGAATTLQSAVGLLALALALVAIFC